MRELFEPFKEYASPIIFSLFGGAAGYALRKGHIRNFWEFSADVFVSVFAGMMIFLLINDTDLSDSLKALFISMGACTGRETLVILQKKFMKKFGANDDN